MTDANWNKVVADEKTLSSKVKQSLVTTLKLFASQKCKPDLYTTSKQHKEFHTESHKSSLHTDNIPIELRAPTIRIKFVAKCFANFDTSEDLMKFNQCLFE